MTTEPEAVLERLRRRRVALRTDSSRSRAYFDGYDAAMEEVEAALAGEVEGAPRPRRKVPRCHVCGRPLPRAAEREYNQQTDRWYCLSTGGCILTAGMTSGGQ